MPRLNVCESNRDVFSLASAPISSNAVVDRDALLPRGDDPGVIAWMPILRGISSGKSHSL